MNVRHCLLTLGLVACGSHAPLPPQPGPPTPIAPVAATPPPGPAIEAGPPLAGRTLAIPANKDRQDLVYVGPRRALVTNGATITLVDTASGIPVGSPVELSSLQPSKDREPVHAITEMRWAWAGNQPVALAKVYASVDAPLAGIGTWRPLREPAPGYVAAMGNAGWICRTGALTTDGSLAAVIGCDASKRDIQDIQLVDTTTRKQIDNVTVKADAVHVVFSPDGRQLAFSTRNFEVGIYDIASKQIRMLAGPHATEIRSLAMRSAEPRVAAGNSDDQVIMWNTTSGTSQVLEAKGNKLLFSPQGNTLAVGTYGKLALVDTNSWSVVRELVVDAKMVVRAMAWSADGAQLSVLAYEEGLLMFDVRATAVAASDDTWWSRIKPMPAPPVGPPPPSDGTVSGVVTLDGKPVVGVELTMTAASDAPASVRKAPPPVTRTDTTGAFRFDNVYRERWQCRLKVPGAVQSGFGADLREKSTHTLKLVLEPAVTLVGHVVDAAGKPVRGARVQHMSYTGRPDLDVVTDASGHFNAEHMRVEEDPIMATGTRRGYVLDVDRPDGAVGRIKVDMTTPGRREFTVKLLSPRDRRVVRFIVVNKAGKPVPNAIVSVNQGVTASRLTDASGRVSVIWDEDHSLPVSAYGDGGHTGNNLDVKPPQAKPITLTLQ